MKIWGATRAAATGRGVARAATAGATRTELVNEAVETLLASGFADRAGVWIEAHDPSRVEGLGLAAFRGRVADATGDVTPAEWTRWSPEAPWPSELRTGRTSVEQELDEAPDQPVVGVLTEMRRALWMPVEDHGRLRGMLFAGARRKHAHLPRALLETVAAELALALELDQERRFARERQADLGTTRRFLAALGSGESTDAVLAKLMESCTDTEANGCGLGAVFAAIARVRDPEGLARSQTAHETLFTWRSGDTLWTSALESEPLAGIWRRALEAHRTIGSEPGVSWSRGEVARVVAIPLETVDTTLGVFVAGFRPGGASLAVLERLEARAALATSALYRDTRREETWQRLASQEALLEASGEALVLLDAKAVIAGLSRVAQELLGETKVCSPAEEMGIKVSRSVQELFRLRDQPRLEAWLQESDTNALRTDAPGASDTGRTLEAELCNGTSVRVQAALSTGGGVGALRLQPLHAAVSAAHSEDGEAQLFNVIEWLEEGVVLFDAHHGIRAVNSRFAQLAGLRADEVRRLTTLNALIERLASQTVDAEGFAERWRELERDGTGATREEIHLLRPVPRILERAARPMVDAAGRFLGRVEIYRDLTAQRVFQSKLLQTEKLAALGQMVTGIAHELSNPLTSILGYAQRLLLRNGPAGAGEETRQIFQEAERASAILRQLLGTARESRLGRNRVALDEVVARTMELQRFGLAAENVRVELSLDPALPPLLGDSGQLQQVLMNLLGNARQAIGQQGRRGTIHLSTRRAGRDRVALEVRDDGPGIPETILARIFDPFFTTKPVGVGTGLGLSIVLSIVREHGGQVHVASPPGGGAVFTLEFPAAPAEAEKEESRTPGLPAAGPGLRTGRLPAPKTLVPAVPLVVRSGVSRGKVLVVEDEPTVARLIGDVLEDDGFRVDVLLDGRKALKRAASEDYDLVICDMKMPGLDGQHFYKSLVRTQNPLREKFLFVTGDVIAAHTHEFLERNHLAHVAKPFRIEELSQKISDVLGEAPADRRPDSVEKTTSARK
jgi:signal transduction histidine kinase/CheY-like chemotaxis protein